MIRAESETIRATEKGNQSDEDKQCERSVFRTQSHSPKGSVN
jgi:hypothetical protein